ncbi:hypothetical protein ACGFIV_04425 [Sphaerisporangium sp. NPDC049003]|uniref:pPIWI_RE_Y domain-containing protein n=1 Tax=Sphaerisporangium sp. NPDC049003 TaxID=3364517 RepID=UPI003717AF6B
MSVPEPGDLATLGMVARGVIDLSSVTHASSFRLPYPQSLQRSLDSMVLAGLTRGSAVPSGVPGLLAWCRELEPAAWPLTLPVNFLAPDTRLIHRIAGEPTRACAELTSLDRDGLPEKADAMLNELLTACGTVERFMACRSFLLHRPVILRHDPMRMRPTTLPIWKLVRHLYEPVPERFVIEGLLHQCKGCGLLAKALPSQHPWCEGGCPPELDRLEATDQPKRALALDIALRLFLCLPGLTEPDGPFPPLLPERGVRRYIDRAGLPHAVLFQNFEQPGPAALRAVRVASLLGEPLDVVVPDSTATRPGYLRSFDSALPGDVKVLLLSESQFDALQPRRSDA